MVDTWRWPKLLYSALSMSRADTPSRVACLVDVDVALDAVVLLVGVDVGQRGLPLHGVGQRVAQRFRSATLSLLSVYW
jgi:hypothetical protein